MIKRWLERKQRRAALEADMLAKEEDEAYSKEYAKLEAIMASIPEDQRWKFRIVNRVVEGTCASFICPMPEIENWADPKPQVNISGSGGVDSGFGALGAGALGFALGSMLDGG